MRIPKHTAVANVLLGIALLGGLACSTARAADPAEVLVLARKQRPAHEELATALRERLTELGAQDVKIMRAAKFNRAVLAGQRDRLPGLIVAVGTDVTLDVLALKLSVPVLSVAIPRLSFDELNDARRTEMEADDRGQLSAIYLDQPLDRRFTLIKQILPKARRIGIVLGPSTLRYADELRSAAERRKLVLQFGHVTEEARLIRTLDQVLEDSDAMLGIVDPLVFSRASARSVLLTVYRRRVPLIGISPSYVSAGALAAVFSSPAEIGRQAAEMIEQFRIDPTKRLPPPQFPKYFGVAVNYQVAESIGVPVEDEHRLTQHLLSVEKSR